MADLTPTKHDYVRILKIILHHSENKEDILWAQIELDRHILAFTSIGDR